METSTKFNCLLDKYHRINVRIVALKDKAREIKDKIVEEASVEFNKPNTSK